MTYEEEQKAQLAGWKWVTHPGFGLIGVVLGTWAAILNIPADFQEPGRLMLAASLMTLGLLVVHIRVAFTSPASTFHPLAMMAASPVYWLLLDLIQGTYGLESTSIADVKSAFLMIGIFSSAVWIAGMLRPWRLPRIVKDAGTVPLSSQALFWLGVTAFGLAFLRFAIPSGFDVSAMLGAFSGSRWSAPWSRGSLGGWNAFLDHIGYFGYVLAPITAFLARRQGLLHWRTLVMAVLTLIIIALFSTGGGRRIVGVLVGSGLIVWLLSAKIPRVKDYFLIGVIGIGLLAFMEMMLVYRGVGMSALLSEDTRIESKNRKLRVDDNFFRLTQVLEIIPDAHPHVGFQYPIWVIARPVPRVFWPSKPLGPGFDLSSFQGMKNVSLTTSLVGELYMAFGVFGCVGGGLLMGSLANTLAQVQRAGAKPGALIIIGGGSLALFAGMRSGIELVLMSYGVLGWIALVWGYKKIKS